MTYSSRGVEKIKSIYFCTRGRVSNYFLLEKKQNNLYINGTLDSSSTSVRTWLHYGEC